MMRLNKEEDIKNLSKPHSVSSFCLFSYFLQLFSIFHLWFFVNTLIHSDIWLSFRPYFILDLFFSFPCHISIISFSCKFRVLYYSLFFCFCLAAWISKVVCLLPSSAFFICFVSLLISIPSLHSLSCSPYPKGLFLIGLFNIWSFTNKLLIVNYYYYTIIIII